MKLEFVVPQRNMTTLTESDGQKDIDQSMIMQFQASLSNLEKWSQYIEKRCIIQKPAS